MPSESSILKVLSFVEELSNILEADENIFINLIISSCKFHKFLYNQFYLLIYLIIYVELRNLKGWYAN